MSRVASSAVRRVALWLLACAVSACSSPTPLATLREKNGSVERDWAAQVRQWKVAEVGAAFHLGDGVQTHAGASARLSLDDGGQLSLDADTQVRFSDVAPAQHSLGFDIETGAASLQASAEPLSIMTRVGLARIEPGATVTFARGNDGLRIVVEVGQAVFGNSEALVAGSGVRVLPDGALAPLSPSAPAPGPAAAPSAAVPATAPAADPQTEITARVRGRGASVRNALVNDITLGI